jgi:hypothetical protein
MPRLKTIEPDQATGQAKQLLDGLNEKFGMVPNLARTLANSPAALQGVVLAQSSHSGASCVNEFQ